MGANRTQAQALALFLAAFVFIAAGFAANVSILWLIVGFALLAASIGLFLKCKPWEHIEE